MMDLEDKLSACILRVRTRMPFFGALALFLRHGLDERVPTACTDGKEVLFNPAFAGALTSAELDAVMVHELLHAALLHVPRRGDRDPLTWNIAADIVVNGIIRQEKSLSLPAGACIDNQLENYEVEEVYQLLLADPWNSSITWIGQDLAPAENGLPLPENERRAIEAHWKKAWQEAAVIVQTQGHGALPAGMRRHLETITHPLLDWRSLLWRHLVRTPVDFTGFDRRFIGSGIYLEALEGETVAARIAVDTSGSVQPDQLAQFLAEVREILRLYPQIDAQLFYADTSLHGPFDPDDESLSHPIGGGGTSFVPFFDRMQEEMDFARTVVLIYLTDGFGTFPRQPPDHPVLWAVTPGGLPSNKFPFGSVARLIAPSSP